MSIEKDLSELRDAQVISHEVAEKIHQYYQSKKSDSNNRVFVAFGILGAILVGLGVILIIAHNWDEFSRFTKTSFSFLPLVLSQILAGYVLYKKADNSTWRESSSALLFFSVGACIALISQIYHLPGDLSSFLLTWMLLCLPIIYVMKSQIASLLCLIGITYYGIEQGYWTYPSTVPVWYWGMLALALPNYIYQTLNSPQSNFTRFHHWLVPLSITTVLGTASQNTEQLMLIAYAGLFSVFYLIGNTKSLQLYKYNSYQFIGSRGTIILFLMLSFERFWENLSEKTWVFEQWSTSPELLTTLLVCLIATGLLIYQFKNQKIANLNPFAISFIPFIFTFLLGIYSSLAMIAMNFIIFGLGIFTIRQGTLKNHLGILNYGLLIISALIICRFLDSDLNFVARGLIFVTVGIGFFVANYWMLKKRKNHEV